MIFAYILLWTLLMGVSIFATQNQLVVTLKFLVFESINLPLGLILVFAAGLGAMVVTVAQTISNSRSQFVPTSPISNFEIPKKNATKTQAAAKPSDKNQTKNQKIDDFDEEWDDDWG